ncbi:SNF2 family helicase [Sorangium cellulosum]|uniref:SNF2 family helicase n=1 Tax=Sorangium cellulosum TaxID=56 RepID=A0A2L0F700_SORCE|nr:DEAD/DEAH box helicase [Sorangium cellulosum]AUX47346.1 SNF2 family helicase [Sorangium cellulosum]
MRPVSLLPTRWDTPQCDDYESLDVVRRFELEVRVCRAHTEPFTVAPLGGRIDGDYAVTSGSGGRYLVDLVDSSARYDTCTCPDFLTNQLGTCKHLEAVRRAVAERPSWRRALARIELPARPTITVDAQDGLRLLGVGAWPAALRAERARLVQPGGLLKALSAGTGGATALAARVVHAAAPAAERLARAAWHTRRQRLVEARMGRGARAIEELGLPLFPYQREGVLHLFRSGRALLADDMGLGKTLQAVAACELLRRRGEARRVLIVTAASLKHQWAQEIARWTGERAAVLGGAPPQRSEALALGAAYTVLSYELTWRDLSRLQALDADVLVLDEAQRAKNFRTKTAATLRAIPSRFLFVLTGTPVENRLDDLYALLQLVDPALLGPLWRFNVDFHRQDERGKVVGYKNLGALRERIRKVVLRRERSEVLRDLPPLLEQTRYTPLTREQRELDADYREQAARLLAIAERRGLTKEEMDRLMMLLLKARQACNALELCDPKRGKKASPKLDELEALVAEIAAQPRSKILVFSEWVGMLALAAERLDRIGVGHLVLHGGVPTERRPALLARFREDEAARVLLSTDAGGVGLNLQEASYVVHLDLPWNPARLDQRTGRAHRLGQARNVSVIYLCAEAGIERGIEGTLAGKRAIRAAALRADAAVEELSAPTFSMFLRDMREVLAEAGEGATGGGAAEAGGMAADGDVVVDGNAAVDGSAIVDGSMVVDGSTAGEGSAAVRAEGGVAGAHGAPAPVPGWLVSEAAPANDAAVEGASRASDAGAPANDAVMEAAAPAARLARAAEPIALDAGVRAGPPAEVSRAKAAQRAAEDRLRLARVVLDAGFAADAARAAYEALAEAISGMLEGPAPESHAALVAVVYRELVPAGELPVEAHAALARLHDLGTLARAGVRLDPALASMAVDEATTWIGRLAPLHTPD